MYQNPSGCAQRWAVSVASSMLQCRFCWRPVGSFSLCACTWACARRRYFLYINMQFTRGGGHQHACATRMQNSGISSSATGTAVANSSETFECLVVLLCSPASSQVFPRVSAVRKPWRGVAAPSPWPSPRRRSREEAARWRSFSAPFVGPRRRLRGVSPPL